MCMIEKTCIYSGLVVVAGVWRVHILDWSKMLIGPTGEGQVAHWLLQADQQLAKRQGRHVSLVCAHRLDIFESASYVLGFVTQHDMRS